MDPPLPGQHTEGLGAQGAGRQTTSPPVNWSPDPFRELISTILSQRTLDANTDRAAARLFAIADSPAAIASLAEARVAEAIRPANFYRTKARTIQACCRVLLERFGGTVPRAMADLLALPGVGRKTANCVRYFAFGEPALIIDTHAHRVANRLGLVRTTSPDDTEAKLSPRLPPERWGPFTDLLVEHGKQVCRPIGPRCEACVVRAHCRRVGVRGPARRSATGRLPASRRPGASGAAPSAARTPGGLTSDLTEDQRAACWAKTDDHEKHGSFRGSSSQTVRRSRASSTRVSGELPGPLRSSSSGAFA